MMGGMQTNIAEAFQSGVNIEGMNRCTAAMKALQIPLCELEDAAELSLYLAGGKGIGIVNGGCISGDNGWTAHFG